MDGHADVFTATQWSVIVAAGRETQTVAQNALEQLCASYWPPLYTYARGRGYTTHDAQDLTQGFFAYLLAQKIYERTDRAKGKFRAFLLASFKNFLGDARDHAQALKRGGSHEFISFEEAKATRAEALFQTHGGTAGAASSDDRLFERTWAETLLSTSLGNLAAAYQQEGKETLFDQLKLFLTAGAAPLPGYAELATRLAIGESTLRSHVTRLRARYREALRAEVRRTVRTDAEVDGELRELLRVLTHA
ncbi:MAG: sigma-70 family RNA polymerase sigma factor [Chthoniobacterales bacterium]